MSRSAILSVLLIPALAAPALAADIHVGHDENADFRAMRTYAWRKGTPAAIPQIQDWIVAAVERELQAKGLRRVDGEADVYVSTVAYGEMDVFVRGNYVSLDRWAGWGVVTAHAEDKTTGNLMVDLTATAGEEPVWRGVAREGFQSDKLDKARKKIDKIVKRLFRDFPPD